VAEPTVDRDPIELLAAEFMERLRDGEHPSIDEYASAHPDRAEEIRELFPTIAAMEKLKSDKESLSGGRASLGPVKIERLGDLRIIREIGRGGMGIVYEAEQESLGRRVAVKVLPKQSLLDDKHLRRFRREAKTAARLHHTNIVPVLGVGEQDGYHYYVMQMIRGVGLDEIVPQLGALAEGTAASSNEVLTRDRRRAENVSSVARAMIDGDLRRLAAAAETSDLTSGISRVSTPSTASRGSAITVAAGEGGSIESSTSFALGNGIEPTALAAGAATTGDWQDDPDASEFGSAVNSGRFGTAYWQSVATIGVQVSNALKYAHRQGTLHRDIKPANLLIDDRGNVWVADFGLAKTVEQEEVSRSGDVVGTLRYMAPEQFHGDADDRSDIFSLGLTLYELLTLKPAYNETERKRSFIHESGPPNPTRPRRINPSIPPDLETIVLKAISTEPVSRYASAADMADDLQRFIEDRPILARRASNAERLWRWARRNPAISSLSAIAASLLLVVAVVSTVAYLRTEQARALAESESEAAQETSRVALAALDKIFERLAPHRYVSPEDFAMTTGEDESLPVDTQPVLSEEAAALLTEMMKSYDELAQISGQNSELLKSVALANRRLGDIRAQLGQTEQALEDYKKAIAAYESLDDESLQDPKTIAAIASVHNEMGHILRRIRSFEDWLANQAKSQDAFARAMRLLKPVAAAGSLPEVRYELARTYYLTANRFRGPPSGGRGGASGGKGEARRSGGPPGGGPRGGPPQGRDRPDDGRRSNNLNQAVALLEELTDEYDVPDYKQLLALCYVEQHRHGRGDAEQDLVAKAIELLEGLVAKYPQSPDYAFTLCRVYMMTAAMGEPEEQLRSIETALSILQRLHDEHPNVPEYLLTRIWVHHSAGRLKLRLDDYSGASVQFDGALAVAQSLAGPSASPAMSGWLRMLKHGFGFALADELRKAQAENREVSVPQEFLLRARDELLSIQGELEELRDSPPWIQDALRGVFERQVAIFATLGEEDAKQIAQDKANAIPARRPPYERPPR
jgi:serine/threonine protein kinase